MQPNNEAGQVNEDGAGVPILKDNPNESVQDQGAEDGVQQDAIVVNGQDDGAEPEGQDGQKPEPPAEPEYVQQLKAELQEMREWKEQQEAAARKKPEGQQPQGVEKPREYTPQEWAHIEGAWGFQRGKDETTGTEYINVDPRKMVTQIDNAINWAVKRAVELSSGMVHENIGAMRVDSIMNEMTRKATGQFRDIAQYSGAIKEFLKKNYHPQDHANEQNIEVAYWYAKGRNMKNVVKQVEQSRERNKKVVQPASPSGSSKPASLLTNQEREAAKAAGMSEQDWKRFRGGTKLVIG